MGKYRQVICSHCRHQYMTHIASDDYDIKINHSGKLLQGWVDKCPVCSCFLYVFENVLLGASEKEYSKSEIISFTLR